MKASEVIARLQKLMEQEGDLEVEYEDAEYICDSMEITCLEAKTIGGKRLFYIF